MHRRGRVGHDIERRATRPSSKDVHIPAFGFILCQHSKASIAEYDSRMRLTALAEFVTDPLRRLAAPDVLCKSFGWFLYVITHGCGTARRSVTIHYRRGRSRYAPCVRQSPQTPYILDLPLSFNIPDASFTFYT